MRMAPNVPTADPQRSLHRAIIAASVSLFIPPVIGDVSEAELVFGM